MNAVQKLMLGIIPPSDIVPKDADLKLFLREIIRRQEPNFKKAETALSSDSPADRIDALPTFIEVDLQTLGSRIEEMLKMDTKLSEALILDAVLTSDAEDSVKLKNLEQEFKKLLKEAEVRVKTMPSPEIRKCLKMIGGDYT